MSAEAILPLGNTVITYTTSISTPSPGLPILRSEIVIPRYRHKARGIWYKGNNSHSDKKDKKKNLAVDGLRPYHDYGASTIEHPPCQLCAISRLYIRLRKGFLESSDADFVPVFADGRNH